MKKKRVPYLTKVKKSDDSQSKHSLLKHTASIQNVPILPESTAVSKEQLGTNVVTSLATMRSTSLPKHSNDKFPHKSTRANEAYARVLGCTYFGQGFLRHGQRDRPSPSSNSHSNLISKVGVLPGTKRRLVAAMHKTATGWHANGSATTRTQHASEDGHNGSNGPQDDSTTSQGRLPSIGENVAQGQFSVAKAVDTDDVYIRYISANRRSRALAYVHGRSKEGEQGHIVQPERWPAPTHQLSGTASDKERLGVRAFNWEGIHFEVSPRRDDATSVPRMNAHYADDMNLMQYYFNAVHSPTPEIAPDNKQTTCFEAPSSGHLPVHNNAELEDARRPLAATDLQVPDPPELGAETSAEAKGRVPSSPRTGRELPAHQALRPDNDAKPESGPLVTGKRGPGRRLRSPPPLTPITNNSIDRTNQR